MVAWGDLQIRAGCPVLYSFLYCSSYMLTFVFLTLLPLQSHCLPMMSQRPGLVSFRLKFRAFGFEPTLIDQASSCFKFSWKERQWIEQRGSHSMRSWIAPVLHHVRCLVMASFCAVADSALQALFRGVVDSACSNAREHI